MLSGRDIVYVSSIDWDDHWQGHQQIASALARANNRVLFIENTGVRTPGLRDLSRLLKRAHNSLERSAPGRLRVREVAPGLWVLAPILLPFPYSRLARAINGRLLAGALARFKNELGFSPSVLWTYLPTPLVHDLLDRLQPSASVYYCTDDLSSSSTAARAIVASEETMFRRVDLVYVTAEKLRTRVLASGRRAELFPSAVDLAVFDGDADGDADRIADADVNADAHRALAGIPRPIAGYVGALHRWVDQALLIRVARRLPEVSFVLVGPDHRAERIVEGEPNIHLLGMKPYKALPRYLRRFDVGLNLSGGSGLRWARG